MEINRDFEVHIRLQTVNNLSFFIRKSNYQLNLFKTGALFFSKNASFDMSIHKNCERLRSFNVAIEQNCALIRVC